MLRLTLKNLNGNRIRFALTAFAVVLAVSFVVASFVLTDGLRAQFNGLSNEIVSGTDLALRPVEDELDPTAQLGESLLPRVAAVDGVGAAAPVLSADDNTIRPVTADGELIPLTGPPQVAIGWIDDPGLSSFTLVEGRAPGAGAEFTIDVDSAAEHGFEIGADYDMVVPSGTVPMTLVGTTSFGADNDTLGATLMQFPVDTLQELTGDTGYDGISVALEPGADRAGVQAALAALSPDPGGPELEVVDNATLATERQESFDRGIDILGNVLLGFAGVSLFVSIFIIYNTFSIVLGQRTRELGLLRLVGADPAQLRRSVLGEALVIGVLASAVGIGTGLLLAIGLQALFAAIGAGLPAIPETITARTAIAAVAVGVGATLVSAIGPARKASRVAPIAALRDGAAGGLGGASRGRTRLAVGAAILAAGVGVVALGLFGADGGTAVASALGGGAMLVFVGVTLLSPVVAVPLTRALGLPLGIGAGMAGRLARQNAGRNPQRTATTAAALMIGLAGVTMALTVGESVKAQLRSTLDSSVRADYVITEASFTGFGPELAAALESAPVVDAVATFRYDEARVEGELADVAGADLARLPALFDLDLEGGSMDGGSADSSADTVWVADEEAERLGLGVGDGVTVELAGGSRELTVAGTYGDDLVVGVPYLMGLDTWTALGGDPNDAWLAFTVRDGVEQAAVATTLDSVTGAFPQAEIETPGEFADRQSALIDQALTAVNALVALAVVIALVGIANTLALSVFERTRELGLLRAVGMSRRQLRRMVRLESALVALFGAALGVATGVAFGWAAVVALPDAVTGSLSIPVTRIAVLVTVAGVAGLVAAWGPARRAGRLNVLDAIAT